MNEEAKKPLDMIEQSGKMLERFSRGDFLAIAGPDEDKDRTLVLASVILTVAAELRSVHNVLHEINMRLAAKE